MSKAFTKETDEEDDDDQPDQSPVSSGKNYITPAGFQKLKDEYHHLITVDRPKVVETVAWAASNGDRSENADYIYGKRRLREIDRRLRFLQKRLDIAEIVPLDGQSSDRVLFGATVTVRNGDDEIKTYRIVGIDETDAARGWVSWISPIGKVLLQTKVGDTVALNMPKGETELEVLKIEYKS